MADNNALLLRTPKVRISYPNLVHPRPYVDPRTKKAGEPKFTSEFLFDPAEVDLFEVKRGESWETVNLSMAMVEVAKATWPGINPKEAVQHGGLNWPLLDGNAKKAERDKEGKKGDVYENQKFIKVNGSKDYPPQLFCIEGGKYTELSRIVPEEVQKAEKLFAGGNYVKANLNLKGVETAQGRFLVFYVNSVLFAGNGERIGGMSAEERFGGVTGGESDYNPAGSGEMDDEILF